MSDPSLLFIAPSWSDLYSLPTIAFCRFLSPGEKYEQLCALLGCTQVYCRYSPSVHTLTSHYMPGYSTLPGLTYFTVISEQGMLTAGYVRPYHAVQGCILTPAYFSMRASDCRVNMFYGKRSQTPHLYIFSGGRERNTTESQSALILFLFFKFFKPSC